MPAYYACAELSPNWTLAEWDRAMELPQLGLQPTACCSSWENTSVSPDTAAVQAVCVSHPDGPERPVLSLSEVRCTLASWQQWFGNIPLSNLPEWNFCNNADCWRDLRNWFKRLVWLPLSTEHPIEVERVKSSLVVSDYTFYVVVITRIIIFYEDDKTSCKSSVAWYHKTLDKLVVEELFV